MIVDIFVVLIFVTLLVFGFLGFLAWQKISVFLTWNTRYQQADYEQTATKPKLMKPAGVASKTQQKGRAITPVEDLVDFADLDFETAAKAIENAGKL